jgi:NADH:ubiquinone oxidoreductase subunit 3 (subunit A)
MTPDTFSPELFTQNWTAVALAAVVAAMAIGGMFSASKMLSSRRHSEAKFTT